VADDVTKFTALLNSTRFSRAQAETLIALLREHAANPAAHGSFVIAIIGGAGVDVDSTDPLNPVVQLDAAAIASLGLADTALQPGDPVSSLVNDAGYTSNAGTVTSVQVSMPASFAQTGGPVTTSGTISFAYAAGFDAYTTAEQSKLAGIAAGATVGANWNTNLANIPANITSWSAIAPAAKQDALTNSTTNTISGTEVQRAALTGDVTAAANSNSTTIASNAVTNAKLADVATSTIKGRATAGTGDPEDLTPTQARTVLELGTAALAAIGTSGDAVPKLNAGNTWSALQTFNENQRFNGTIQIRVTSYGAPDGVGIELFYTGAGIGYIIAYDRDLAVWKPLYLYGNPLQFYANGAYAGQVVGTGIEDAAGNVRAAQPTTGGLTLGRTYRVSSGFTINTGLLEGGLYGIYNNSASAITLTQGGGLTLRLSGTTNTGNRTLAAHGYATIWANSTTEYIVGGDVT